MGSFSHQQLVQLQNYYGVVLCRSSTESGDPFFHYVMADKENIEKMHQDHQTGKEVDFASYGEILISGWGENPTPEYERLITDYFDAQQ